MEELGHIAVIGGGSWATALAKLVSSRKQPFTWYLRKKERIAEFERTGRNPVYLSDVKFDTSLIHFTNDIDEAFGRADTVIVAVPSPYLKWHTDQLTVSLEGKNIVSAVKGIVPDDNMLVTDWFADKKGVHPERMLVIGGPCHAEEVALERLSYLTIGCHKKELAETFASSISGPKLRTVTSTDVEGIEYAAVLKNVYAIAAGMMSGMKSGDNLQAMMVSNAVREMRSLLDNVAPCYRDICESAYLGDLLVTAYSRFSRNHNFGAMIGKGYSVQAAKMEMSQIAEGYYGAKCIHLLEQRTGIKLPIASAVYEILYENANVRHTLERASLSYT